MQRLAKKDVVLKTMESLESRNIKALYVKTGAEAKQKALELIPQGAEVMTMTSVTVDSIGLAKELNESGKYNAVKPKLFSMDRKTQGLEMQKLGAAPEWSVGSVHAITQEGNVVVASNSGSQLPGYVYGSPQVLWIVSTKKIVKDLDSAFKRVYDHVLPLESERANKAYGITSGSNVSKLLIFNKEVNPKRITLIFVDEALGF